jgi:hypothetical protein
MFAKRRYAARPSTLPHRLACRLLVVGAILPAFAGLHAQAVPPSAHRTTVRVVPGAFAVRVVNQASVDSVIIDAPLDQAWTALVAVYEELELPISVRDPSNQLGTRNYRVRRNRIGKDRLSRYLDCGQGPTGDYANVYNVTLELLTTLRRVETDRTVLLVQVQASAKPRSVSGHSVPCTPNSRLAQRLGELVAEQLRTEGGSHQSKGVRVEDIDWPWPYRLRPSDKTEHAPDR